VKAATSRDVAGLTCGRALDDTLNRGLVSREKVQGQWLYLASGYGLEQALSDARSALERSLGEWLLNPGRFLVGTAAKQTSARSLAKPALALLTHELCARGELLGLPLLTKSRQPYLAFFRLDDEAEIDRQVAALRELLKTLGQVSWRDLPEPRRSVPRQAWRTSVVAHGEWLGLGWRREPGELKGW
jgi:hypothetical protein